MADNCRKLHDVAFSWLQHVGPVPKNPLCEIYGKETTVTVRGVNMVVFSFPNFGFGDHIMWHTLDEALVEAKSSSQPIMLVIHKSWCGACKALKPKFSESKEIAELSKNFVMVNLEDNEEPKGGTYAPDGGYIPRILFLNSEGEVQTELYNQNGNPQYKYFYSDADSIATMMRKVISDLPTRPKFPSDEL